jgi:hypothetical protein
MTEERKKLIPFNDSKRSAEFGKALLLKVIKRVNQLRDEVMPQDNVSVMPHGHTWTFQQKNENGFSHETGEFQKKSSTIEISHSKLIENDISSLDSFIKELSSDMHEKFMESLISEMNAATERTGRVTNISKNESLAEGILNSLEDLEHSVDAQGNITGPTLMLNSETYQRLQSELMGCNAEFEERAKHIKEKAKHDALKREEERLAKFE